MKTIPRGFLPESEADADGKVWNLAYGANMNPKSAIKRRGLKPFRSIPVFVNDWQLTFDYRSFAAKEPCFGNI